MSAQETEIIQWKNLLGAIHCILAQKQLGLADFTQMKAQKLMFYCVGVGSFLIGKNISVKEEFEAWKHGPVLRSAYNELKQFGAENIPQQFFAQHSGNQDVSAQVTEALQLVLTVYARLSPWELREQSHLEKPWAEAYEKAAGEKIRYNEIYNNFENKFGKTKPIAAPEYALDKGNFGVDHLLFQKFNSFHELAAFLNESRDNSTESPIK